MIKPIEFHKPEEESLAERGLQLFFLSTTEVRDQPHTSTTGAHMESKCYPRILQQCWSLPAWMKVCEVLPQYFNWPKLKPAVRCVSVQVFQSSVAAAGWPHADLLLWCSLWLQDQTASDTHRLHAARTAGAERPHTHTHSFSLGFFLCISSVSPYNCWIYVQNAASLIQRDYFAKHESGCFT